MLIQTNEDAQKKAKEEAEKHRCIINKQAKLERDYELERKKNANLVKMNLVNKQQIKKAEERAEILRKEVKKVQGDNHWQLKMASKA